MGDKDLTLDIGVRAPVARVNLRKLQAAAAGAMITHSPVVISQSAATDICREIDYLRKRVAQLERAAPKKRRRKRSRTPDLRGYVIIHDGTIMVNVYGFPYFYRERAQAAGTAATLPGASIREAHLHIVEKENDT